MLSRPLCAYSVAAHRVTFADLGCGSGCIGLSLLEGMATARLTAIDAAAAAVETSR